MSAKFDGKSNKFSGDGVAEFEVWKQIFLPEADKKKCKNHFEWKEEDVEADGSVPEEVFKDVRICPVGQEREYAEASQKERIDRLKAKYEKQLDRIMTTYKDGSVKRQKEMQLLSKFEDDEEAILSSFEKDWNAAKTSGDQYDKKEKEFKEDRANAISLLRNWLGPNPLNMIHLALTTVGPKNAFKQLVDNYNGEADTAAYLNSVTSKMDSLRFDPKVGTVGFHMSWLEQENATLVRHGHGLTEAQLLNYLFKSIERNKEAHAMFKPALDLIMFDRPRKTRIEALAILKEVESMKHSAAQLKGQVANFANVKFGNRNEDRRESRAAAATVQKKVDKKRPASKAKEEPDAKKVARYCAKCGSKNHLTRECEKEVFCKECNTSDHAPKYCWKTNEELRPHWYGQPKKVPSDNIIAEVKGGIPETPLDDRMSQERVAAALGTSSVTQNGLKTSSRVIGGGVATFNVTLDSELLQRIDTSSCENCTRSFWGRSGANPCRQYACTGAYRNIRKVIIDSGASQNMLPEEDMFVGTLHATGGKVVLGSDTYKLEIEGMGKTRLACIGNALLVPRLSLGLLSVAQLDMAGYSTTFEDSKCVVRSKESGVVVLSGTRIKSNLYVLDRKYMRILAGEEEDWEESEESAQTFQEEFDLMHRRMGHASEAKLKKGLKNESWTGVDITYDDVKDIHLTFCPACYEGQMKAHPRGETSDRKLEVGDKFGIDYKGKFRVTSVDGYNGFYLLCDYASNYLVLFLVKSKDSEITEGVLTEFYHKFHLLAKKYPQVMQCDYDTVLQSEGIANWLRDHKIKLQMSAPYTHWQNGMIERSIGKVMDTARTMMAEARVPHRFWSYAVRCAVYMLNRLPVSKLEKTPLEEVTGDIPDMSHAVPFWSSGVYHKKKEERKGPWDLKAVRVRMVGYHEETKNSYYVYEVGTNRTIKVRHDCVWDESLLAGELSFDNEEGEMGNDDLAALEEDLAGYNRPEEVVDEPEDLAAYEYDYDEDRPYWAFRAEVEQWFDDVNERVYLAEHPDAAPLVQPNSLEEALADPVEGKFWKEAYDTEIANFESREVFKGAPQHGPTMKTKIILKKARKADGSIKYKVRLVAKGFTQVKGVNYNETYAPTTSTEVVLVSMQLAVIMEYQLSSFDVTAAFLEGKNDYPNFARLPEGFGKLGGQRVQVVGNFYGEKQGPKIWNDKLHEILVKGEFKRCPAHPCLYRKKVGNDTIFTCVHVDDGLVATSSSALTENLKRVLLSEVKRATFEVQVKKYIGIDVHWDEKLRRLKLSHEQYILDNWATIGGTSEITMCPSHNLRTAEPIVNDDTMLHDTGKFRFVCDRARPDVLVATGEIATGGDKNPSKLHKMVAQRTKEYLYHTRTLRIEFGPGPLFIFGYCDAAYITVGNCKSRLGGCIFLNLFSGAVRTFSKTDTQPSSVSHSSTEAEIKAIDEWCREVLHILDIVSFLIGRRYDQPVLLLVDNQSAIQLCTTLKQNHKVKHINVRITFIRELVHAGVVKLCYVTTELNTSDYTTKPLAVEPFQKHRETNLHGHGGALPAHKSLL